MLERGFGPKVPMASEDVVATETCYKTTPEALESMLIYFLNVRGRTTQDRLHGQAEGSTQDELPRLPSNIYELLQRPQNEIEELVAETGKLGRETLRRQLADLKEQEKFVETQLARALPDSNCGEQLDTEPHDRLDRSGIHDLPNYGIISRQLEPKAAQTEGREGA